jgi:biopolymer transport protein ExbD
LTKNAEPEPLPPIDQQPPPSLEQPPPRRIEIDVNAQGQIRLNGELVTMEELQRRLKAIVENEKHSPGQQTE